MSTMTTSLSLKSNDLSPVSPKVTRVRRPLARFRFFALALLLILPSSSLPAFAGAKSVPNTVVGDSNLSRYANNNPVMFTDPTGLVPPSHDTYVNGQHFNTDAGSGRQVRTATSLTIVAVATGRGLNALASAAYRNPGKAVTWGGALLEGALGLATGGEAGPRPKFPGISSAQLKNMVGSALEDTTSKPGCLTRAGRAMTKQGSRQGRRGARPSNIPEVVKGNNTAKNSQGASVLSNILSDPTATVNSTPHNGVPAISINTSGAGGAMWHLVDGAYQFQGFR